MVQDPTSVRVQVLIRALDDTHVSVVWNATRDLARLGSGAAEALPALQHTLLTSHDPTSRLWARFAIAKITGDSSAHLPELIKALHNKRTVFPGMAAAAIAGFGPAAWQAIPSLIDELSESNPEYRWSAAGALANIGPIAVDAVPALIERLVDIDEKVRWYAAWALGEIGPAAGAAVPALTVALNDVDDDVRGYAARSIGNIGGDEAVSAIPLLRELLEDPNPGLQDAAREVLTKLEGRNR